MDLQAASLKFAAAFRPKTQLKIRMNVKRWRKYIDSDRVGDIPANIPVFREAAKHDYAPASVEMAIADLTRIARSQGIAVPKTPKLRTPNGDPHPPTPLHLGVLYSHSHVATWPKVPSPERWWQAFFVLGAWTALRKSDLLTLQRKAVDFTGTRIDRVASKTSKCHNFPVPPFIERHIKYTEGNSETPDVLLGFQGNSGSYYYTLTKIARAAAVPRITTQHLRQFGITAWTCANATAGDIVHGKGIGVLNHYLDKTRVLESVMHDVEMPAEFYSPEERRAMEDAEEKLLRSYRRASGPKRKLMVQVVQSMA